MQGIPGSGKSTWARNFIKNNSKNWVIVNRDSIRDMLGNYWVPSREKLVDKIEEFNICMALTSGYNVIIDATNLNKSTITKWETLVERYNTEPLPKINIELEFKEFKVSVQNAIFRDWKRGLLGGRKVGKKVIKDFYRNYYANNKNTEKSQ